MNRKIKISIGVALISLIAVLGWQGHWFNGAGERMAVRVAKQKVGWNFALIDEVKLEHGVWRVDLIRFPHELGGHATVHVSTNGDVVKHCRGK